MADEKKYWSEEDLLGAQQVFHQPPESYNCAQSVMVLSGHPEQAAALRPCGGGRVEGGLCGALYTALLLTPEDQHDTIREIFQREAGALTCREIKGGEKTPCLDCVALATALVRQYRS